MNLIEQQRGANIASQFYRLLALDDVWTSYLEAARTIPPPDIERLRMVVNEMDALLASFPSDFEWMATVASQHFAEFDSALGGAMARLRLTASQKADVRNRLKELGPHEKALGYLYSELAESLPLARKEIANKIELIESGRHTPGDLPRKVKCLLSVAVGIGGYWCPPLIGAGVGGVLNFCL